MSKLTEMLEAGKKATPGPWYAEHVRKFGRVTTDLKRAAADVANAICMPDHDHPGESHANADFIASARNALPEIEAMLAQNEKMREWILNQAGHSDECDIDIGIYKCTCGLSTLRALLMTPTPVTPQGAQYE